MPDNFKIKGEIDAALVAHIKWVVIFKSQLSGIERDRLDPATVRDDTACVFGKWLHANMAALPLPVQFEHIDALHGAFHIAAAEIAMAINQYQRREEIGRQMVELERLSKQLIAVLQEAKARL
jgi:hypothetical protein